MRTGYMTAPNHNREVPLWCAYSLAKARNNTAQPSRGGGVRPRKVVQCSEQHRHGLQFAAERIEDEAESFKSRGSKQWGITRFSKHDEGIATDTAILKQGGTHLWRTISPFPRTNSRTECGSSSSDLKVSPGTRQTFTPHGNRDRVMPDAAAPRGPSRVLLERLFRRRFPGGPAAVRFVRSFRRPEDQPSFLLRYQ
jgi:hypothetical protein